MEELVSALDAVLRRTQYTFYCIQFENSTTNTVIKLTHLLHWYSRLELFVDGRRERK